MVAKQNRSKRETLLLGRLLALLVVVAPIRASVIDIPANTSGYVTHNYWNSSYHKSYGDMGYEFHYDRQLDWVTHGFVKFDLGSMPDSCTILSAELHFYQRRHWSFTPFVGIGLIPDPDSMDARSLYDAAASGGLIAPAGSTPDGWITWSFYPGTMTQLDSCRRSGWISCAAQCLSQEPTGGLVSGCDSTEAPYLRIEYVIRGPEIQASRAELATYPLVANGTDTALLELTNRGLYPSGPFWAYASLGLARESTLVEPIAVGETASFCIAIPSPSTQNAIVDYHLWATAEFDTLRPNDSLQLRCWSFDTAAYATEGFDEPVFPPPGWLTIDRDGRPKCWLRQTVAGASHTGNGYASCLHESVGVSDDWLISGPVCPSRDYLDSVGFFPSSIVRLMHETLEVWTVSERYPWVRLLSLAVHDTAYLRRAVSLDASDGDTIQVGFRMRSWGAGSGLCLDDVWFSRIYAPDTSKPPRDVVRRSNPELPEFAFEPNPATGRHVMVRCGIARGTLGKLTLRDVLGRSVKSLSLGPSGVAQLDLRGLAPGVYMATLEAGTQSLTRKLIITRR